MAFLGSFDLNSVLARQTSEKVAFKSSFDYLLECFLPSTFARITSFLPEKISKISVTGGAAAPLAPPARTPMILSACREVRVLENAALSLGPRTAIFSGLRSQIFTIRIRIDFKPVYYLFFFPLSDHFCNCLLSFPYTHRARVKVTYILLSSTNFLSSAFKITQVIKFYLEETMA